MGEILRTKMWVLMVVPSNLYQNKLKLKSQSRFLDSILVFCDRSSVQTHGKVMGWGGFK